MKRKVVGILLIISTTIIGLASAWFALPETYSAFNELALVPVPAPPGNWQNIDEYKWGIRFRIPPGLTEKYNGNLWIHENDSLRVIVDFGPDSLVSYIADKVQLKTAGLRKNYAQKVVTLNGLKTLICSYEKATGKPAEPLKAVELIYLEKREYLGAVREPSYRVEYKSENDQIAMQILQSVSFFNP